MHDHNTMLKEFIQSNEGKLKKLQDDAKIAQVFHRSHLLFSSSYLDWRAKASFHLLNLKIISSVQTEAQVIF